MFKQHKIVILALLLLNLYGWVISAEVFYGIPQIVKYILAVSVLGSLIWYRFVNPSKDLPGSGFNILVIVFIAWSSILLIGSVFKATSIYFIQMVFAVPYYFIPYLLPIILLYTKFDLDFFSELYRYSYILIIPTVVIQLVVILSGLSQEDWSMQSSMIRLLDISVFLLLFTGHLIRKKYIFNLALLYFLIWLILWAYYGRRGMMIDNLLFILFMVLIRLRSSVLKLADRFRIYFTGLVVLLLLLSFGYLFSSTLAFQRGFSGGAIEESRGYVFETFFYDFGSIRDWLIGRGLDGTVLRSFASNSLYSSVENGFLTILLKGGLLYSIPFVVIILGASYMGFFRSKNDLSKALAAYLLIYVILMAYFNLPDYSTHYIFVWISASACFSPDIRNISNEVIFQKINSHFKN